MQSHDNDQRPKEKHPDGRRDTERGSDVYENLLALSQAFDVANGKVHLAEPGKPFNLSANISGRGGAAA